MGRSTHALVVALVGGCLAAPFASADPPLRQVVAIPLPGVAGRLDHLALDAAGSQLFVAALGNDSVEVIDLRESRVVNTIGSLSEPQGLLYLPGKQRLYATLGGAAAVAILEGRPLAVTRRIATPEDPDNLRIDPDGEAIWIGAGSGARAALMALGASDGGLRLQIALDGHPESFQLESRGPRIFVNVPGRREVEVADRRAGRVVARWKLPCAGNFPMALDEPRSRVLVACRRPPRLLALDAESGAVVGASGAPADADDLFVDAAAGRIYTSGGEGLVRVHRWTREGQLERVGDVPTGSGARTSLFDAPSHRLYVAVPRQGSRDAEVQAFDTSPWCRSLSGRVALRSGSLLKPAGHPADAGRVHTASSIGDPTARAEALGHDVKALVRERRDQDPGLRIVDALIALELVKTSLLEESGIATTGRRTSIVVAAVVSVVVTGVAVFLLSR